jgi:hypothetical protein
MADAENLAGVGDDGQNWISSSEAVAPPEATLTISSSLPEASALRRVG